MSLSVRLRTYGYRCLGLGFGLGRGFHLDVRLGLDLGDGLGDGLSVRGHLGFGAGTGLDGGFGLGLSGSDRFQHRLHGGLGPRLRISAGGCGSGCLGRCLGTRLGLSFGVGLGPSGSLGHRLDTGLGAGDRLATYLEERLYSGLGFGFCGGDSLYGCLSTRLGRSPLFQQLLHRGFQLRQHSFGSLGGGLGLSCGLGRGLGSGLSHGDYVGKEGLVLFLGNCREGEEQPQEEENERSFNNSSHA